MTRRARTSLGLVLAALAAGAGAPAADQRQEAAPGRPSLLVLVVVDQMRADYLTRLAPRFTGGLRRLVEGGAVFEQAFYPYLNTVTCAGHATLGTGTLPRTHGIILNEWYRRDLGRVRACTVDPDARPVPYGGTAEPQGHSAVQLRAPTLAERLRERWPASRSVTLSLKARSAIMLAGKGATAVTWFADHHGWQTSTAYTAAPLPAVAAALGKRPYEASRTAVWDRVEDASRYTGADDGQGERPSPGWTAIFPHPLAGQQAAHFEELWRGGPYSDEHLGATAAALVSDFGLGQRGVVDFLGVSFSATDVVGHDFGPDSHEVQDNLLRLDRTLGTLLDTLDRTVGRDRYALALSADHGVAPIPEARRAAGASGGRVPLALVADSVNAVLSDAGLGEGRHVARVDYTELYLSDTARAAITPAIADRVVAAIRAFPGVRDAVWGPALDARDAADPLVRAIRASYVPDRSGDFTLAPAPYYILVPGRNPEGGSATTHGSSNDYDQHVPLVFYGRPFAAGHRRDLATPADAAPTLAATVGLRMAGVDGRVLPAAASSRARR
jgi:arylsulfatase A-like enzyme